MTKKQKLLYFCSVPVFIFLLWLSDLHCVWRTLFGIPCLGCGMTRAYMALLRLNIGKAFRSHFMFWSVPLLFWFVWKDGKVFRDRRINLGVLIAIGAGFLIRWILLVI